MPYTFNTVCEAEVTHQLDWYCVSCIGKTDSKCSMHLLMRSKVTYQDQKSSEVKLLITWKCKSGFIWKVALTEPSSTHFTHFTHRHRQPISPISLTYRVASPLSGSVSLLRSSTSLLRTSWYCPWDLAVRGNWVSSIEKLKSDWN